MYRFLYLALIVYGAFSQITQALLIREDLVVFYGNEISLGAFFGSWLLWIAVGSALAVPFRQRLTSPLQWVRAIMLALPFLLGLQIIMTRLVRNFFDISSTQFIALGDLFTAVSLINMPTALAVGLAFPLACQALQNHVPPYQQDNKDTINVQSARGITNLYIFDAFGALVGGFAFTFLLIEWTGVWATWAIVAIAGSATSLLLGKIETDTRSRIPILISFTGWLSLSFSILFLLTPLESQFSRYMELARFKTLQPGLQLLDTIESRYGHVAIARFEEQTSLINDGRVGLSFPNREEAQKQAAYFYSQAEDPRRILMFGGAAGDLTAELLRYPVDSISVVEQDRLAYERTLRWLPAGTLKALNDERVQVHLEDGRHFTNRVDNEQFDLVLVLSSNPSSAHENRFFTHEVYQKLRRMMPVSGVICTEVSSASNYLGRSVSSYSGSVLATLQATFSHVAIMPGDTHTYCASSMPGQVTEDAGQLRRRYLMATLDEHTFPASSFYSMLPPDRIDFVRHQLLGEAAELNTDARPITYYYNMILWGKFSSSEFVEWLQKLKQMGAPPYVIPLLLLVLLTLLRFSLQPLNQPRFVRQSANLILVVLGMIAMATQLTLLYSYQAHVGFVFSRIALLNSFFMAGLAIGAGFIGQRLIHLARPAHALIGVMLVTTVMLELLPLLYERVGTLDLTTQQGAYLGLTALVGLLTGAGFPLAVSLTQTDTGNVLHSSGITAAADNLGGALGGFVTGALLVPILGVRMTCYTLGLMAFLSLLPLLYASTPLLRFNGLRLRGYQAFTWSTLSWLILWIIMTVFTLMLMVPAEVRQPTVTFDQTVLNAVSQSQEFELKAEPLPHYLGYTKEENTSPLPDTVSLASMAVDSEIRGYAGPVNLLLGLDSRGSLRGVQYIESDETPSYISDIDQWLNSLKGINLSSEPLSLDNLDGLSGATISSQAVIATLNKAASQASLIAFDRPLFTAAGRAAIDWWQPKVIVLLLVLALFFPVWRSGRDDWRLYYQGLVLVVLGFWFNALVTEVDLVNLTQGRIPSAYASLLHFMLITFTIVITVLLGQVYCGYICPFGALQEFISRLGRYFYIRNVPGQKLERRMRYVKYVLLALMLLSYWLTEDMFWVNYNPMQHFFAFQFDGWILPITVISLAGALVYYRFWCRYFCPFGAFLAFGNKLALLLGRSPQRVYKQCDLGVRDDFDIDCIRCHRCIEGKDYGQRKGKKTQIPTNTTS